MRSLSPGQSVMWLFCFASTSITTTPVRVTTFFSFLQPFISQLRAADPSCDTLNCPFWSGSFMVLSFLIFSRLPPLTQVSIHEYKSVSIGLLPGTYLCFFLLYSGSNRESLITRFTRDCIGSIEGDIFAV